jgi:hypothetical protein
VYAVAVLEKSYLPKLFELQIKTAKYRGSHNSRAIGELGYLAKYGKM